MRIHIELTVEGPRLTRPRRPRTLVALAALAVALLLPAVALANHQFSDVATTHTFHTNISNLAGAGVTAGCGGGKYCPEANVTRGQMAAFLNRGLGRVAEADTFAQVTGTAESTVGSVTMSPGTSAGAPPGANQFIHAQFNGSVRFGNVTGCPCRFEIMLELGNGEHMNDNLVIKTVTTADDYFPISHGGVIAVEGSAPVTVRVRAMIDGGGGVATQYTIAGNLVTQMIPFGSTGTSAP
jgi:hypothetical protein